MPNAHRRYSFAIVTMEPSHAIARWDFFWALRIALDAGEGNRDKRRKITAGRQADWRSLIFIFKSKEKRKRKKERKGGKKEKEEHLPLCTVFIGLRTMRKKSPPQASPPQATIIFCRVGYLPTAVGGGLFFGWGTYLPSGGVDYFRYPTP